MGSLAYTLSDNSKLMENPTFSGESPKNLTGQQSDQTGKTTRNVNHLILIEGFKAYPGLGDKS